jgi:hypothetical protein
LGDPNKILSIAIFDENGQFENINDYNIKLHDPEGLLFSPNGSYFYDGFRLYSMENPEMVINEFELHMCLAFSDDESKLYTRKFETELLLVQFMNMI